MFTRLLTAVLFLGAVGSGGAAPPDPIDKIREADLKRDLFALAGDAMRGREGGTLDEMTASAWVAERAREAGLLPAGDNGTYFQFFPLERLRVSASSTVTLDGKPLRMGRDVLPDNTVLANVDAPVTIAPGDNLEGLALKDHLPYARAGVPALFFTTLLHADYHTPFDNPDRIDTAKLTKMTRWMYATGRTVAEADKARAFDPAFKLERCRDSTGNYCGG